MSEINRDSKRTYETLCKTLDNMHWQYSRDDENQIIKTSAVGEDLTIPLRIVVSDERNVMYIKSVLPFKAPQEMRSVIGEALHRANYSMLNGCFEYDLDSGCIAFKMVVPFEGSLVSTEVCHYMVILTCQMVDKFNDKIKGLIDGRLTLEEFEKIAKA